MLFQLYFLCYQLIIHLINFKEHLFIFNFSYELMDVNEYLMFYININNHLKYLNVEVIIIIINFKIIDIILILLFHIMHKTRNYI